MREGRKRSVPELHTARSYTPRSAASPFAAEEGSAEAAAARPAAVERDRPRAEVPDRGRRRQRRP